MDNRYNLATTAANNAAVSCHTLRLYIFVTPFFIQKLFPEESHYIPFNDRKGIFKKKAARESNFIEVTDKQKGK